MIKESYLSAIILTIIFAVISEGTTGTFSTIWDYTYSNLDSETVGEIVKSEVDLVGRFGGVTYDIRYSYTVNDKEYVGSQVSYGSDTNAVETQKKYPLGLQVTVYYDSLKPQYSTLVKTTLGLDVYGQIIILGVGFFLMAMLFKPLDY
ncbi:MAG: DUF3592 domain-containing protein [Gammaproteobacteria bacterium]|nr:DUF3592 domain-containing protein [Gammaproteobacteria bacterium]